MLLSDMKPLLILVTVSAAFAQQPPKEAGDDRRGYTDTPQLPNQRWKVHDAERPRPPKVTPGPVVSTPPPADAIVLFDGKDLSKWDRRAAGQADGAGQWKVENGTIEIVPRHRDAGSPKRSSAIASCTSNG